MKLKKLLLVCGLGLLYSSTFAANASVPEYDNVPITPQTWQEVDLTYDNYIDGKKYTEIAKLLRPIDWLKQRNLDIQHLNKSVHLTEDDVGTDINATITAIKSTSIYFDSELAAKNLKRPVVGAFIRHANNVTDYTFKDESGKLETIQATPEHPFYSINRHDYIPIGEIWQDSGKYNSKEQLKTDNGSTVILVNAKPHNGKVEAVYNFEVYKAHNYLVGNKRLLVHNECDNPNILGKSTLTSYAQGELDSLGGEYVTNKSDIILYRADDRSPTDIKNAGGFFPQSEEFNGVMFHTSMQLTDKDMANFPKSYQNRNTAGAVSMTTNPTILINDNDYGNNIYRIHIKAGEGIMVNRTAGKLGFSGWASETQEVISVAGIPYSQIEFLGKRKNLMVQRQKVIKIPYTKKLTNWWAAKQKERNRQRFWAEYKDNMQ